MLSRNVKINVCRTIISFVVLYGCEVRSFVLREEHRLRVVESRVLRRLFGPKRVEVTRERKRLHNEELYDLYCSPNIVRGYHIEKNEMGGVCSNMGQRNGTYGVWMEPEGKRPLDKPRRRWKGNVKIDRKEVGGGNMDLDDLRQDSERWLTLVNAVMDLRVP